MLNYFKTASVLPKSLDAFELVRYHNNVYGWQCYKQLDPDLLSQFLSDCGQTQTVQASEVISLSNL